MSFIHQCSKYGSIAKRLWTAGCSCHLADIDIDYTGGAGWQFLAQKEKSTKWERLLVKWVWWAHVLCHMWAQFVELNCDCVLWFVFANSADSISRSQLLSEAFEISNIYCTSTFAHEAVSRNIQSNMKIWECVMIRQLQLVVLFIGIFIPNLFSWTI